MNISTLQVKDEVAIARSASWSVIPEGTYVVEKVNKVRVVLHRKTDGYVRVFSARTGKELAHDSHAFASSNTFIETVEDAAGRQAIRDKERVISNAWDELNASFQTKNLSRAEAAIDFLKKVRDEKP
jgi:hypothetical protein